MKRGDVVTVAAGSGFGSKPRPALVIQTDDLADLTTVIVVMFTSDIGHRPRTRPHVPPDATNGLREPSDLMADLPIAVRRNKIGPVIGRLPPEAMARAERALLLVLGFAN